MVKTTIKYRPRIVDMAIRRKLKSVGALLIEGPKWCGKTTTAEQIAGSKLNLGDPDELSRARLIAISNVAL